MENNQEVPQPEENALTLVRKIKDKVMDPRTLTKEQRQLCVETLVFEGSASQSSLAEIFQVSDRTIRRDIQDVMARNAITTSPEFVQRMVGEYVQMQKAHIGHLMKLARDPNASVGERAQAGFYAMQGQNQTISTLQSLGYLPKTATNIAIASFNANDTVSPRIAAMAKDLEDMQALEPDEKKRQILKGQRNQLLLEGPNATNTSGSQPA